MKNLITSMACIAILLAFVLQFAQNQVLHNRIISVDQNVNAFKEVAKQEGYLSKSNIKRLKEKLASAVNCSINEIVVDGTVAPVYRGKLIEYKVSVPIKGIIAASQFWGISDKTNNGLYTVKQYTTSEFIGKQP